MADEEGFEPPEPLGSTVFKTAAIDHSATHPSSVPKWTRKLHLARCNINQKKIFVSVWLYLNAEFTLKTTSTRGSNWLTSFTFNSFPGTIAKNRKKNGLRC